MQDLTLIKDLQLAPSRDYAALRAAGIKYIEQLGHEWWTDYNSHDPGITILEALCYSLTDLGYRTGFSLQDLLTRSVQDVPYLAGTFHSAREIMPTAPVTFEDLRKMLVDIHGVRQAWVEARTGAGGSGPANLGGLYDAYLEYEEWIETLSLGLEDNTLGEGKYYPADFGDLRFTVSRDLIIESVHVYTDEPGYIRIELVDADDQVLTYKDQIWIEHADIKSEVSLGFLVLPHEDPDKNHYRLRVISDQVKLFANTQVEFDFALDNLIEIIPERDEVDEVQNYYFLYDWEIDFPDPAPASGPQSYTVRGSLGAPHNSIPGGGDFADPEGKSIAFNVETELILEKVYVYGEGDAGGKTLTLEVRSECGGFSEKRNVRLARNGNRTSVNLGITLSPGQNYTLEAYGKDESLKLYFNYEGAFPYHHKDVMYLVGGTEGDRLTQTYYFYYDWQISYQRPIGADIPQLADTKAMVRRQARDLLLKNRSLATDLLCIKTLKDEEVALCADVGLTASANVEEVLAEIYYQLEMHVKPPVRFYTLEEMIEKGKRMEEIFEGPALDHGFIDQDEFTQIDRTKPLRVSDIIHLLMDIPGVISVSQTLILSFIDEICVSQEKWIWCPVIDPCRVPNFSPKKSNLIFYKDGLPYYADKERALEILAQKEAEDLRIKHRDHAKDLPMPVGEDMEVIDHYPAQNDLPLNYMVGQYRVPESESDLRKAQSNQLKGFLLFFEQFLANYLAQLAHVPELFSWDTPKPGEAVQTYFTQTIDEIADLNQIYADYDHLRQDLLALIEDAPTAHERKLRFQEHLVARFAESFTEYSFLMFHLYGDGLDTSRRLIEDKQKFLKEYPALSQNRALGFDYRYPEAPYNLAGIQARVYRQLGFRTLTRPDLAGDRLCLEEKDGLWCFVLRDEEDEILFESICCPSKAAIQQMLDFTLWLVNDESHYEWKMDHCDGEWQLLRECKKGPDEKLGASPTESAMEATLAYLQRVSLAEGFHVVEHILLRERVPGDPQLPNQLASQDEDKCETCPAVEDPYSFMVSIVLPAWSPRFQRMLFRQLVEKTLRMEAPAHVLLRICWIGHEQMKHFEDCLEKWECELACLDPQFICNPYSETKEGQDAYDPVPPGYETYRTALAELIVCLNELEQVYPAARLHDCENVNSEQPQITLNTTNLQTLG